jgi:hypothetical protein
LASTNSPRNPDLSGDGRDPANRLYEQRSTVSAPLELPIYRQSSEQHCRQMPRQPSSQRRRQVAGDPFAGRKGEESNDPIGSSRFRLDQNERA